MLFVASHFNYACHCMVLGLGVQLDLEALRSYYFRLFHCVADKIRQCIMYDCVLS